MSLRSVCNTLIGNLLVFGLLHYALAEKPKLLDGDLIHVHTTFEGAAIHDRPYDRSKVIKNSEWLEHFFVIKEEKDRQGVHWVRVGDFVSLNKTNPKGWIKKDDLLMNQTALKEEGIYKKAIVITRWDEKSDEIAGAKTRKAPMADEVYVYGQALTISAIHYVYDKREDFLSGETFTLLGRDPRIMDPEKPDGTILGWVNDNMLFKWNTRLAAEYDKSNYPRKVAKLYETKEDVSSIILKTKDPDEIQEIAREDILKTDNLPEDPRFPIKSREQEIAGYRIWEIGFIGDQIVGGKWVQSTLEPGTIGTIEKLTWTNAVDVLIVFDGSGSMIFYKDAVISAVRQIQEGITSYWMQKHPAEAKATVRFSATMYRDYIESVHFKRIPFTENSSEIERFIQNHDFSGGMDEPAVFNGIAETLSAAGSEFDKSSIRLLILIGDMGNLGRNYTSADPRGHTVETISNHLKDSKSDFYAIHVADASAYEPEYRGVINSFMEQSKSIMVNLDQEKTEMYQLTSPQHIKEQIVAKVVQIIDQRYGVSEFLGDLTSGTVKLASGRLTGTILEQRAIDIMIENGIDPNDFVSQNVTPFGTGWVLIKDPESDKQLFKHVVLMDKDEVERLISLLGQMTKVSFKNVKQGWMAALEHETGDMVSANDNPAVIITKHLGIPVKSGVLSMSFTDIGNLPASAIKEAIMEFERKLFLLRAVNNEQEIEITEDDSGLQNYNVVGSKKHWFGTIRNQRVWLDTEIYMP